MVVDINGIHLSSSEDMIFKEAQEGVVTFKLKDGDDDINSINIICKNGQSQDFTINLHKDSANIFCNVLKGFIKELENLDK